MNTSEHALILELEYRFRNLLELEGKLINLNELLSWIDQNETAKRLTFPYIGTRNYYAKVNANELEAFYYQVLKQVKRNNWTSFTISIPENLRRQMISFIKSTEELKRLD